MSTDMAGKVNRGRYKVLVAQARELVELKSADILDLTLAIAARPAGATEFILLPHRGVVERSFGWLMHARRNVRDYERLPARSEAHIAWAAMTLMTRRLTLKEACT